MKNLWIVIRDKDAASVEFLKEERVLDKNGETKKLSVFTTKLEEAKCIPYRRASIIARRDRLQAIDLEYFKECYL